MTHNKKRIWILARFCVCFVTLLVIVVVMLSKRERVLAQQVALEIVDNILANQNRREKYGIPETVTSVSNKPGDTNLYLKNWNFWFDVRPKGSIEVRIYAPRGLPFIPLLNRKKDLKIGEIKFMP